MAFSEHISLLNLACNGLTYSERVGDQSCGLSFRSYEIPALGVYLSVVGNGKPLKDGFLLRIADLVDHRGRFCFSVDVWLGERASVVDIRRARLNRVNHESASGYR